MPPLSLVPYMNRQHPKRLTITLTTLGHNNEECYCLSQSNKAYRVLEITIIMSEYSRYVTARKHLHGR